MGQSWQRLAFLHWPVDPAALAELLPPGVEPDVFDGSAWIGVTPFEVHSFRLRVTLPFPLISTFPELNVRTYVSSAGKPGIWFLSLDTSNRLAVHAARWSYRLPYHHASQEVRRRGGWVEFASKRGGDSARFAARYRPDGPMREAVPGSFEYFTAERYCLYTVDDQLAPARRHTSPPVAVAAGGGGARRQHDGAPVRDRADRGAAGSLRRQDRRGLLEPGPGLARTTRRLDRLPRALRAVDDHRECETGCDGRYACK